MDDNDFLLIPVIRIYTGKYTNPCPKKVFEFQPRNDGCKLQFNFGLKSSFYITIYALACFEKDQIQQLAKCLYKEINNTRKINEGLTSIASSFSKYQVKDRPDSNMKDAELYITPDELRLNLSLRSFI